MSGGADYPVGCSWNVMQASSQPEIICDTSCTTTQGFSWLGWEKNRIRVGFEPSQTGIGMDFAPSPCPKLGLGWDFCHPKLRLGFVPFPCSKLGLGWGLCHFWLYLLGKREKLILITLGSSQVEAKPCSRPFSSHSKWDFHGCQLFLDLKGFGEREDLG